MSHPPIDARMQKQCSTKSQSPEEEQQLPRPSPNRSSIATHLTFSADGQDSAALGPYLHSPQRSTEEKNGQNEKTITRLTPCHTASHRVASARPEASQPTDELCPRLGLMDYQRPCVRPLVFSTDQQTEYTRVTRSTSAPPNFIYKHSLVAE